MNEWLVTGGAGFIGTNLARHIRLASPSDRVVCFDNFTTGSASDAHAAGFDEVVEGDIRDLDAIQRAIAGTDFVVHLAAQTGVPSSLADPRHDLESNIVGSFNVLESARAASVKKVVLASSAAPIGETPPPMREESLPKPISPYGASKLSMESYANVYRSTLGLDTVCLRFSNVYGPLSYRKGSVVARFFSDIFQKGSVNINGDGSQTRDFVFVTDICEAIRLATETETESHVIQLGTGVETSIRVLATMIFSALGRSENVHYGEPLAGEVQRNYADIRLAQEQLRYSPATDLTTGIRATAQWFDAWAASAK